MVTALRLLRPLAELAVLFYDLMSFWKRTYNSMSLAEKRTRPKMKCISHTTLLLPCRASD
jgi:hypothetical protein